MGGQRRTAPCTVVIFASEKNEPMPFAAPQMSLDVNTPHVVSEKVKDTYPIISLLGVTQKLIPMKIFTQRKASTDSLKKVWFPKQKVMRIGYITILGLTEIYKPCEI